MIQITQRRPRRHASALLAVLTLLAGLAAAVTFTAPSAGAATSSSSVLRAPGTLRPGSQLHSPSGDFRLVMARGGRAYLETRWGRVLWSPKTGGHRNAQLRLLSSGRLEIVSRTGKRLWWARTSGRHARLTLGNNGQLRLTSGKRLLWHTRDTFRYGSHDNPYPAASLAAGRSLTAGHTLTSANGRYHATMLSDGAFTVSGPYGPLWTTSSDGWEGALLTLTRGDLVLRTANGVSLWSSRTSSGALLVLGNDGNLVLNDAKGRAVWQSARATRPALDPAAPAQSTSHYLRNLTGAVTDAATMSALGEQDAEAGSGDRLVVLDVGAQFTDRGDGTQWGVELTGTDTTLTDDQLVTALEGYLDGYGSHMSGGSQLMFAVATNNDSAQYKADGCDGPPAGVDDPLAAAGGAEWARVINQLAAYLPPTSAITVAGADDIEPGLVGCVGQAYDWTKAFAANSPQPYVFIGAADGCPSVLGKRGACNYGWTQQDLYDLAYGLNPARSQPVPQIFNPAQAVQWGTIGRLGGTPIPFAGVLTQQGVCGASCSLAGSTAWNELANQLTLSTGRRTGAGGYVTDLDVVD